MTKLNPKGKNVSTNIHTVAAKREQTLKVSANGNLQFKKEPLQMLYELTVSTLFGKGSYYKSGDQLVKSLKKQIKEDLDKIREILKKEKKTWRGTTTTR